MGEPTWRPMGKLMAGKLAYLHFEHDSTARCLGYVDGSGMAEWPDRIRGLRPAGWCDVSDMLFVGAEQGDVGASALPA